MSSNLLTEHQLPELRGNSVCILGYGREGQSVLRHIRTHHPQLRVGVADRNTFESLPDDVVGHFGDSYLDALTDYDTIVRSPGISFYNKSLTDVVSNGPYCTSATNLFFQNAPGKTVAITGTKGKSTTSALLAHLLQLQFADIRLVGNIGNPVLDSLEAADEQTIFVVECSSFQLEDFHFAPDISIVLQIVDEHLDYHGNFNAYRKAKTNICRFQSEGQFLIYNPTLHRFSASEDLNTVTRGQEIVSIGQEDSSVLIKEDSLYLNQQELLNTSQLKILGPGNLQNAMASTAAASLLGVPAELIASGLKSFAGLAHRLEKVAEVCGIEFYDDSLSTIPQATMNALAGLGPKVESIIIGGHDRGLCFEQLGQYLARSCVKTIISFPSTGEKIWQSCLAAGGQHIRHVAVDSMKAAVAAAFKHTSSGQACLLSPASSSLNMFRDYRDRAEQFLACIEQHSVDKPSN